VAKINTQSSEPQFPDAGSIQRFIHDARTPLSIVMTGLEALKSVRTDEKSFDQILKMMKSEGADRLRTLLDQLSALAASAPIAGNVTDPDAEHGAS
jgi:hypothetical protein